MELGTLVSKQFGSTFHNSLYFGVMQWVVAEQMSDWLQETTQTGVAKTEEAKCGAIQRVQNVPV